MVLINHSKKSFLNILIMIAENEIPNKTDHRMNISGNIPILTKKIPINIKDEQKLLDITNWDFGLFNYDVR